MMNVFIKIKKLAVPAALAVMLFAFGVFSQAPDTAYIPFLVNVNAAITASREGVPPISINAGGGVMCTLSIYLGTVSIRHATSGRQAFAPQLTSDSRGNVRLRLPEQSYQNAEVSLYSANGRRILRHNVEASAPVSALPRSSIAPGVYLLSVKGKDGGAFTSKLTHRGGRLNINVAYGAGRSASLNKSALFAEGDSEWTIRVAANGYKDSTYRLTVSGGVNAAQTITLDRNIDSFTETADGLNFKMIKVEGGTFTMGCTPEQGASCYTGNEEPAIGSEEPAHTVTLSDFYIGEFEVTQKLWLEVTGMERIPHCDGEYSDIDFGVGENYPVYCVNWYDIVHNFLNNLNAKTGKAYRLPTEAEWEYAARGGKNGDATRYSGSDFIQDVAWYDANTPGQSAGDPGFGAQPVGMKQPNELGIYDMSGNVFEWVHDFYGAYYSDAQTNPNGPPAGVGRMARGGSWYNAAWHARVSARFYADPDTIIAPPYIGFRLALGHSFTETAEGLNFRMIKVDGGTFTMGCTAEQGDDCRENESPAHSVTLSDYYIGEFEVTWSLWYDVMGTPPPLCGGGADVRLPACASWNAIEKEFLPRLNAMTGKTYRLPTEAEWEFAARGGNKSGEYKYAGSNAVGDVAWYSGNSGGNGVKPVGTKAPNELGLYDMSGNVFEWVHDRYGSYSSSPEFDPIGPQTGTSRVIRGGSWSSDAGAGSARVSYRDSESPSAANIALGFRLAIGPYNQRVLSPV